MQITQSTLQKGVYKGYKFCVEGDFEDVIDWEEQEPIKGEFKKKGELMVELRLEDEPNYKHCFECQWEGKKDCDVIKNRYVGRFKRPH